MKPLYSTVAEVLTAKVAESDAERLSLAGLPSNLCEELVNASRGTGVSGKSLFLYVGESAQPALPAGALSGPLDGTAITKARNKGLPYVLIFPGDRDISPPDSIRKSASAIPGFLDDVEEAYFRQLGLDPVPEWHESFVRENSNSDAQTDLERARWGLLAVMDQLIVHKGWKPEAAFAAALGVPSEESGTAFPRQSSRDTLHKLARFMADKSQDKSGIQFEERLGVPGLFNDPEKVRGALKAFFDWLIRTGAVSLDWKTPGTLYRFKASYAGQIGKEYEWRKTLDASTWGKLLSSYSEDVELSIEVLDSGNRVLETRAGGGSGFVLVDDLFALQLIARPDESVDVDRRIRDCAWLLSGRARRSVKTGEPHKTTKIDLSDGSPLADLFKDPVSASPDIEEPKKPKATLVNLKRHTVGLVIFVDEGQIELDEVINQPAFPVAGGPLTARVVIAEPGIFTLSLAHDAGRWAVQRAELDGADCNIQKSAANELSFRVNSDGQEQLLCVHLLDEKKVAAQLLVRVHVALIKTGDYASSLHHLAACHAATRRLAARIDIEAAGKRSVLMQCAYANEDAFPGIIGLNEVPTPFKLIPGTPFLTPLADTSQLRTLTEEVAAWELPPDVRAARRKLINEIRAFGDGQPVEVLEFLREPLASAVESYLTAFDKWVKADSTRALSVLEWMESVHVVSTREGVFRRLMVIQLPLHPLRLRSITGMLALFGQVKGEKEKWYPPLSRLYAMAGPRAWVMRGANVDHVYRLVSKTEHYYPVYERDGAESGHLQAARRWLDDLLSLKSPAYAMSMSALDVCSVMDDVCALNPSMSEFTVSIASDPMGEVTNGIFDWYFETAMDGNAPEFSDWASCSPMDLRVYSNEEIIRQHDVDGRAAHYADSPGRRLMWHRLESGRQPKANFSIFGELATIRDSSAPNATEFPSSVSLHRFGACWKNDYVVDTSGRRYSETLGNGGLDGSVNQVSTPGGLLAQELLGRWDAILRSTHRFFSFAELDIQTSLQNAHFVALPISSSNDVAAAAGVEPGTAVWKFEQCAFGVGDSVSGHIILTKQLGLLVERFSDIVEGSGLKLPADMLQEVMIAMGKAGINTLHAMSDNELVLLGSVTSLAVMRNYSAMPFHGRRRDGLWPSLILPLDPYDKLLSQLKAKKRPDFLCFDISEQEGRLEIEISILESKWRGIRPSDEKLHSMLDQQCLSFRADMHIWLTPTNDDNKSQLSAALLLAELIAAAIRLRELTHPTDKTFCGVAGARRASFVAQTLLNGSNVTTKWGRSILVCVGPDFPTSMVLDSKESFYAMFSAEDATRVLLDSAAVVDWAMGGQAADVSAQAPQARLSQAPRSILATPFVEYSPQLTAPILAEEPPQSAAPTSPAPPDLLQVTNEFVIPIGTFI